MTDIMTLHQNEISNKSLRLNDLEEKMLELPQAECSVTHSFGPGIYMREVFLPKGSIVMGHHQNFEHVNIFIKGHITFFADDGRRIDMKAPMHFLGKPGRKVAFIHEDSTWINVYSTNETDVEKLEKYYLTKSEASVQDKEKIFKNLLLKNNTDLEDYFEFLKEFNLSEEKVRQISENENDQTELPFNTYKIKAGTSLIEGKGLIATADIESCEIIAPARIEGKRTIAGRFANHSKNPNAQMVLGPKNTIYLKALKKIQGSLGGRDGEEITINYRDALSLNLSLGEAKCQQ